MKFKFCGNIDSPEWVISEIIFLAKISAIRLRMLCNNIANFIINNGKNFKDIQKSLDDMNLNESESKIIFSLLEFILKSSVKFDVDDEILNNELQQLGLPQENADSITKVYKNNKENLKNKLKEDVFNFSQLHKVEYKISYILANDANNFNNNNIVNNLKEEEDKKAMINSDVLQFNNFDTKVYFNIQDEKNGFFNFTTNKDILGKLINDLNKASEMIKKLQDA
jgi:hypothetical protein